MAFFSKRRFIGLAPAVINTVQKQLSLLKEAIFRFQLLLLLLTTETFCLILYFV
jgi:hypothetical protein